LGEHFLRRELQVDIGDVRRDAINEEHRQPAYVARSPIGETGGAGSVLGWDCVSRLRRPVLPETRG
jgi:hypothetical protein